MASLSAYKGGARSVWSPLPCGADIDWGNHFSRGLSFCTLLNERSGIGNLDLVSRSIGTTAYTSTTSWNGGLIGGGYTAPGGANVAGKGGLLWANSKIGDVTAPGSTAQLTVDFWVSFTTTSFPNNSHPLAKNSDVVGGGVQGGWLVRFENTGTPAIRFTCRDASSGGFALVFTPTMAVNKLYHFACTYNQGTGIVYMNGQSIGSGSGTPSSISNTSGLQVGKVTDGSSAFPGAIYCGRVWTNRALSGSEVAELYRDPYGMFLMPGRRLADAKFFAKLRRRFVSFW